MKYFLNFFFDANNDSGASDSVAPSGGRIVGLFSNNIWLYNYVLYKRNMIYNRSEKRNGRVTQATSLASRSSRSNKTQER